MLMSLQLVDFTLHHNTLIEVENLLPVLENWLKVSKDKDMSMLKAEPLTLAVD